MPLPIVGALFGGVAKKLAGKALRWVTRGKLIGQGGGRAAAGRIAGALGTGATVGTIATIGRDVIRSRSQMPSGPLPEYEPDPYNGGGWRIKQRARRMNPMNVRALRRAVRRVGSAEKLFRQVFTISGGKVTPRTKRR